MEYKFRGKVKETHGRSGQFIEWVYGSLITTPDGTFILETGDSVEFQEPDYHANGMGCGLEDRNITDRYEAMKYGFDRAVDKMAEVYPQFIEVISETVGMYIGLRDKNGKEVYQGDNLKRTKEIDGNWIDRIYENYVVAFNSHIASFEYKPTEGKEYKQYTIRPFGGVEIEITGNIHDKANPLADSPAHHRMFDPNLKAASEQEATNEQAIPEQAPAPTAGEAQDSEEGGVEG